MTAYSSFFSSGLLAAHHAVYNNFSHSRSDDVSPSLFGLSDPLDDSSDIEMDRSSTPVPPTNAQPAPWAQSAQTGQPKLRRRKSSLTMATSPMNMIKSPSRSAGNAIQLQRHLFASPSRSRSGSASSVLSIGEELAPHQTVSNGSNDVASKSNSLFGRMRSGSVGSALKSRRIVRRVPGPSCPPPSLPLPPLPSLPSIPGTPSRSKTKAFSIQVPASTSHALAQKLAAAGNDVHGHPLQAVSPTSMSPRQPLGDLQLQGHGNAYVNDQDVPMKD
ncbi:hypothetical protein GYMLUDRAFT_251471 [Collybiopsis luxurians FD-317 M1]|uniref:Uncharacterized protein n=1 Tax=Collybiopsis luxurians FD-317 M1 TaxID=944289 RepID=A0A0D0C2P4_9AGAR|nr:hypothetical protein GYMLUDRAFT_251471 [Collybiopsis luxurians FD-317 M1]